LAWRALAAIHGGTPPLQALQTVLTVAPIAGAAVGLLGLLAWLNAKTTVYTLTNRRVVLRFGVAFPKAYNLPLPLIDSAAVAPHGPTAGDLALTLKPPNKIAFMQLWPHARPWRLATPQPTLRALADVQAAAALLVSAMKAQGAIELTPQTPAPRRVPDLSPRPEASAA
ncbi:MAG: photosynthetic complex putative assembly protein PuhB, partial [Caulobacteraceae bacterium]